MTRLMVIGLMSDLLTALSLVHTEDQLDMFSDIHCTQTLWGDVINGLEGSGRSWPDWWSLGLWLICLLHYLWFTKDQLHNMFFDIQCTQTILCGDDIFVLEEDQIDHDRIDGYPVQCSVYLLHFVWFTLLPSSTDNLWGRCSWYQWAGRVEQVSHDRRDDRNQSDDQVARLAAGPVPTRTDDSLTWT